LIRKKLSDWVRPGVEDVRARPRTLSRELIKLDLPTFERPRKAISLRLSCGQSAGLKALLMNSALVIFIESTSASFESIAIVELRCGSSFGLLSAHRRESRHPLAHDWQARFDVRNPLDHGLQVLAEVRIVEHLANAFEHRLDLHVNEDMLAVSLVEELFVDGAVGDHRASHVPVRDNHAEVAAMLTHHGGHYVFDGGRVESEQPIAGFAHDGLAPQVIEFQNQICIFMFTHSFCSY